MKEHPSKFYFYQSFIAFYPVPRRGEQIFTCIAYPSLSFLYLKLWYLNLKNSHDEILAKHFLRNHLMKVHSFTFILRDITFTDVMSIAMESSMNASEILICMWQHLVTPTDLLKPLKSLNQLCRMFKILFINSVNGNGIRKSFILMHRHVKKNQQIHFARVCRILQH